MAANSTMTTRQQQHGRDTVGKSMYYIESIPDLSPPARELLENYSKIPPDEVVPHTHRLRDQAWEICPYGCVGTFAFSNPTIQIHPEYASILAKLKTGETFLDLGCGFEQNMRKLILDGTPAANVAGSDLSVELIDCGYNYFGDRDSLASKFYLLDILNPSHGDSFHEIQGSFNIIWAAMLFHLWDFPTQTQACINSISLLKPQPGSVLMGWQLGGTPASEIVRPVTVGEGYKKTFRHDPQTWDSMWDEVGERTGTRWKVAAANDVPKWLANVTSEKAAENETQRQWSTGLERITFSVTRL